MISHIIISSSPIAHSPTIIFFTHIVVDRIAATMFASRVRTLIDRQNRPSAVIRLVNPSFQDQLKNNINHTMFPGLFVYLWIQ